MFPLLADAEEIIGMGVGFFVVAGIPIVAILAHHQRKMAELIHGARGHVSNELEQRVLAIHAEVAELRAMIMEHILRQDDRRSLQSTPPAIPAEVPQDIQTTS